MEGLRVLSALAAAIQFLEFGPFQVHSTSAAQLSSEMQELRISARTELQVKYVAPAEHCSSVRMHFLLNGIERGVSGSVGPGRSSGYFDFGVVSPGEHVVGLRAEGLVGGCNNGQLTSWGGYAVVRTTAGNDAEFDSRAASFGPVIFYSTSFNYSSGRRRQGIYVAANGDVYAFEYEPAQRDWIPAPDANGRIAVFDLQERFSHHPRWLLKLDTQELRKQEAALAAIDRGVFPTPARGVQYDAGTEYRGAYTLDTASGRYVDVPICSSDGRREEPPFPDSSGLCKWLDSLSRLADR